MTTENQNFEIFYAWQSDLPEKNNRYAIRTALNDAIYKINSENPSMLLNLDQATRNEPGSPNIPDTILKKIKLCDVFVCDITTINSSAEGTLRRTPNPNVLFELGYAVAYLGWKRIVMLYNKEYGNFSVDVPFDIDRQRITHFSLPEKNNPDTSYLCKMITEAIDLIIKENPTKPAFSSDVTTEELKRINDIKYIELLLANMPHKMIADMVDSMPDSFDKSVIDFWVGFNDIVRNPACYFYDKDIKKYLGKIYSNWENIVSYGEYYYLPSNSSTYIQMKFYDEVNKEKPKNINIDIEKSKRAINKAYKDLITIVKERYMEIGLEEIQKNAIKKYNSVANIQI